MNVFLAWKRKPEMANASAAFQSVPAIKPPTAIDNHHDTTNNRFKSSFNYILELNKIPWMSFFFSIIICQQIFVKFILVVLGEHTVYQGEVMPLARLPGWHQPSETASKYNPKSQNDGFWWWLGEYSLFTGRNRRFNICLMFFKVLYIDFVFGYPWQQ